MDCNVVLMEIIGMIFIIVIGSLLHFTFFPPRLPVFKDSTTGRYGAL